MNFERQLELVNMKKLQNSKVTIIGCGAVGSFVGLTLAKMGVKNLDLFDDDIIESHNLPNQMFPVKDIGLQKVESLENLIKLFSDEVEIKTNHRKFVKGFLSGIIISAVDTMKARKNIWHSVRKSMEIGAVLLYIDCRMGGKLIEVHAVTTQHDFCEYEEKLYSESQVIQERCTARAIIYTVLTMAGIVCRLVAEFVSGKDIEKLTIIDIQNMNIVFCN